MLKKPIISHVLVFFIVWSILSYSDHILQTAVQSFFLFQLNWFKTFILVLTAIWLILDIKYSPKLTYKYTFLVTLISFYTTLNLFGKLHILQTISH